MTKATAVLLVILLASAAGLVTSQHQARKLYADLEREQQTAKQIEVEWGQLQIEQSTFSMHSHIEKVAASRLRMATPATQHVQMLYLPRGATR
ncbi:MAG: cell division protein FtsL [Betaproteobacteria bacterium]|nr:cell division protein FtsL [Betaproteobacteria bacterium]